MKQNRLASVLAVPVVERLDPEGHACDVDLVRVRVEARIARLAGAVRKVGEAGVTTAECVRDARIGRTCDDVARADRDLLVAEPKRPVAAVPATA